MSQNIKAIYIVAGGPQQYIPEYDSYKNGSNTIWMGVDRGVYYLLEKGIIPTYAVGDFDSINEREWEEIKEKVPNIKQANPEKDETDLELALFCALEHDPEKIIIWGATGGRLDHFMANAFMLSKFQKQHPHIPINIMDQQNTLSVYFPETHEIFKDEKKKYVSFIPLSSEIIGLTLKGFKYPLTDKTVEFGSSLCISNELIQQSGTFSFEKGILMMVRSTD